MAYPYLIVQEIFIDPSPKWRDMSEHCWQIVTASPPGCDSYDHFFLPTRGITDQRTSRVSLIIESFFFLTVLKVHSYCYMTCFRWSRADVMVSYDLLFVHDFVPIFPLTCHVVDYGHIDLVQKGISIWI